MQTEYIWRYLIKRFLYGKKDFNLHHKHQNVFIISHVLSDSLCYFRASVHPAVCLPYVRGLEPVCVRRSACRTYVDYMQYNQVKRNTRLPSQYLYIQEAGAKDDQSIYRSQYQCQISVNRLTVTKARTQRHTKPPVNERRR